MGMKDEIDAALQAHAAWRKHFKDYLYGHAACDLDAVSATDQCDFGRWLGKEGHRLMPTDLHGQITTAHAEFHRVAGDIVHKIKQKQFDEARQDIAREGRLNNISAQLTALLLKATLREAGGPGTAPPAATASASPPGEPLPASAGAPHN